MQFRDLIWLSARSLSAAPLRSSLTMLGIAIGILSVVLLTSLGRGVQGYILETFSQFGTRIVAIHPGRTQTGGTGGLLASTRPLTIEDAEALSTLAGVEQIVPMVQGTGAIEHQGRVRYTDILGVSSAMPEAWRFDLAQGSFFPDSAGSYPLPQAVIGDKVWRELFKSESALGSFLRVGGERYRIVGVLAPKGQMLGYDLDDIVYIDTQRALTLFNRVGLMEIDITYSPNYSADQMVTQIKQRLIERHKNEDFSIMTQDQMMDTLGRILDLLNLSVAGLGAISLVVGSIGILTIMVTNVHERRAEIGLFRALGASQQSILYLFLLESVLLSMLGGIAGLCLAFSILGLLTVLLPDLPISISPLYLALAILIAFLTGLFSGVIPARQAAQLDPVTALQSE